ncbi:MAG: hypothetical protein GF411_11770 [Candidatus Lokiarchaeota archaeon]|nr:hypothetical protein [Candidatus Lokiarchaeota archaeon]
MSELFEKLVRKDSIYFELDVKDLERAKEFYHRVLGLEVTWDGGDEVGWCQLDLPVPGTRLGLNLLREGEVTPGSGIIYFDTLDLDKTERYLLEHKVKTEPINDIPNMVSILIAHDPDGNRIGFISEPRVKTKKT